MQLICDCGDHLEQRSTHRKDVVRFACVGCGMAWELRETEKEGD